MHNHNNREGHEAIFVEETILKDGFSFHPKLAEWLTSSLKLSGYEKVKVHEAGCTEESCPIEETILEIQTASKNPVTLKIGRVKNQISKNDLYFAIKKQLSG